MTSNFNCKWGIKKSSISIHVGLGFAENYWYFVSYFSFLTLGIAMARMAEFHFFMPNSNCSYYQIVEFLTRWACKVENSWSIQYMNKKVKEKLNFHLKANILVQHESLDSLPFTWIWIWKESNFHHQTYFGTDDPNIFEKCMITIFEEQIQEKFANPTTESFLRQ